MNAKHTPAQPGEGCDDNRLRVAAPDLLAALERIDSLGNGIGTEVEGLSAYAALMRCGSIARAALAKAKGQA